MKTWKASFVLKTKLFPLNQKVPIIGQEHSKWKETSPWSRWSIFQGAFAPPHLWVWGTVSSEIGRSKHPSPQTFSWAARLSSSIPKFGVSNSFKWGVLTRRYLLPCIRTLQKNIASRLYIHIKWFISRNWWLWGWQVWNLQPRSADWKLSGRGWDCSPQTIQSSSSGKVKVKSLSHVWLFVTPWTIAYQGPPSVGFSRQQYWGGLPFPSPGDLPDLGIEPRSPALRAEALPSEPP